jgi:hypothetical protein
MADYAALQEQNKLTALRQMAAGNPDPYAGGSGVISGAEQEALNRYTGDAVGRNAPAGSISQGEQMIRGPADAALKGMGESGDAYVKNLAALQAEAANAAANPASVPQVDTTSGRSGRQPTKAELQEAAGYKQYGGYNTSAEEENAVLGRAMEMRDERDAAAQAAQDAARTATVEPGIAALKAQQAKNEAIVGGPGAVIHGVGWKDNPTPWTPPVPAAPSALAAPPGPVAPAAPAQEYVGRPGFGYWAPAGRPGTPSSLERSNYTPEQVAMLTAAAKQTADRYAFSQAGVNQWNPRIAAIEDPRNIYEFAQRAAVNELGADRYESIGRFSPDWAMRTYALPEVTGPNDYQAAQNEALERQGNQAAGLGAYTDAQIRSRNDDIVRATPGYATGMEIVNTQMEAFASGAKTDQPITVDGLRAEMAKAGVPPAAAVQVIKDLGTAYPGASFFNQPQENIDVASSVGENQMRRNASQSTNANG